MKKRKFEIGDEVIVLSNKFNRKNTKGIIKDYDYSDSTYKVRYKSRYDDDGWDWYRGISLIKVEGENITSLENQKTKLESQLIEITKKIDEVSDKIKFVQETGLEFNENVFKAYQTITIVEESKMSKVEKAKAKAIAQLFEK